MACSAINADRLLVGYMVITKRKIEAKSVNTYANRTKTKVTDLEAFTSMVRAGADIVVSYAALDLATWIREDTR